MEDIFKKIENNFYESQDKKINNADQETKYNQGETIEDLKNKIIRCLNIECKSYINKYIFDNKSSQFHFILPELKSEKSKDEIYNIINCYYNNYSTYIEKISGIEIKKYGVLKNYRFTYKPVRDLIEKEGTENNEKNTGK